MSKELEFLNVALSKPVSVYHPGEWVKGTVIVHIKAPMKMRGIRIQFYGGANVHWTETVEYTSSNGSQGNRTEIRNHIGQEAYVNQTTVLFGKEKGDKTGSDPVLGIGQYQYQFQFQLPATLPSSFESANGQIRYYLKAIIDKAWKFDDTFKRPFTVLGVLDLNEMSQLRPAASGQDEKTICCWCCASGPIQANLSIARSGYVPGEFIFASGAIWNNSSRKIQHSVLALEQIVTYHATTKSTSQGYIVSEYVRPAVEARGRDTFSNVGIHVPPLPPSLLADCKIIRIDYILKLLVKPTGLSFSLNVPLVLGIGTIPFRDLNPIFSTSEYVPGITRVDPKAQNQPPPSFQQAMAPPDPSFITPDNETNAPLPSYVEVGGEKNNIKDEGDDEYTQGNLDWSPAYTYYTWYQPPQRPPDGSQQPFGFQRHQPDIAPVHT